MNNVQLFDWFKSIPRLVKIIILTVEGAKLCLTLHHRPTITNKYVRITN